MVAPNESPRNAHATNNKYRKCGRSLRRDKDKKEKKTWTGNDELNRNRCWAAPSLLPLLPLRQEIVELCHGKVRRPMMMAWLQTRR